MVSEGERIGFGVFGYGFMAGAHLEGLRGLPGTRAVAVCGPRLDRAQALAEKFGVPLATQDPAALLAHPEVDAVIVDTPDDTHYELVMAASRRGKHVFCEKPLAPEIVQAREMAAAVRDAGVRSAM